MSPPTPPGPAWDALPRGALVGRYVVLERLGAGGMGVVYSAYDPQLDRRVALKLLRPGPAALSALLVREARLMAQVQHPDVVGVYDVGTLGGNLFIAMEHVDGQTLKAWLAEHKRSWREVLPLFLRAGQGLAAAHVAGVVHRDFKPDNVLVGRDGRVRVTDFGVARLAWEDERPSLAQLGGALWPAAAEGGLAGQGAAAAGSSGAEPRARTGGLGAQPEEPGSFHTAPDVAPVERTQVDVRSPFEGTQLAARSPGALERTEVGAPIALDRAWPAPAAPRPDLADEPTSPDARAQLAVRRPGQGALFGDTSASGLMVGSPAYMAPEILDGKEADARSDLFSFSVALYEGLYGERPFAGPDVFSQRAQVKAGQVREAPRESKVPSYLRRAVLSGLLPDPAARCPSMDDLLAALTRDPARRWRRGAAAAALLALLALFVYRIERGRGALCQGAELRLAGAWDEPRRLAVKAALPAAVWDGTARLLDAYATRWVAERTEACEATRIRGEQSEQLLDLKMECLDRKLTDLGALTELFAAGVGKAQAADAAAALPSLEECRNAEALRTRAALPGDPESKRRIAVLRDQLARANALALAGDAPRALELSQLAQLGASAGHFRQLAAEAEWIAARAITQSGDAHAAESASHRAAADAERAGDDTLAATAFIGLTWDVGHRQGRAAEGKVWASYASAALERAGGSDELEALRLRALAFIDFDEGQLEDALLGFHRAQALLEARKLTNTTLYTLVLEGVGLALEAQGRAEAALAVHQRSLALRAALLGPEHPNLAFSEDQVAGDLLSLGRPGEALEHAQRGLAIRQRALAPDSPFLAYSLSRIGYALHALGRDKDALDSHQRALELAERRYGPEHRDLSIMLQGIGEDLRGLKRPAEAIAPLERALALREKFAVDASLLGETRFELAQAVWDASHARESERARSLARAAAEDFGRAISHGERVAETKDQRVAAWLTLH